MLQAYGYLRRRLLHQTSATTVAPATAATGAYLRIAEAAAGAVGSVPFAGLSSNVTVPASPSTRMVSPLWIRLVATPSAQDGRDTVLASDDGAVAQWPADIGYHG